MTKYGAKLVRKVIERTPRSLKPDAATCKHRGEATVLINSRSVKHPDNNFHLRILSFHIFNQ